MIGKKQLEIDISALAVHGVSTSDNIADGSHSPLTGGVNLLAVPGAMYPTAVPVNKSTNMVGVPIGHSAGVAGSPINGFILDDQGYVYSLSTSQVLTASSQLSGTYQVGTSDIVQFIDKIYITSTTDVAIMNTDLSSGNATWWSSTESNGVLTSGVRHPMVIFQDLLWIGDGNSLHYIANSSTTVKGKLVLVAGKEITALGVEPSNGYMLIATSVGPNYSDTLASRNSIFVYDGTSSTYSREYPVDGTVTGFKVVGGITYVFYDGNKIGYWTGTGVKFLRQLQNVVAGVAADIAYKHHSCVIGSTLYVIDGAQILAFGEIITGGRPVWRYVYQDVVLGDGTHLSMLCPAASGLIGFGFVGTSAKFYTLDPISKPSSTSSALNFYSNRYIFPRPVFLRGIYVEFADAVAAGDTSMNIYAAVMDMLGAYATTQIKDPTNTFSALKNVSASSVYSIFIPTNALPEDKVWSLQLSIRTNQSAVNGIRRIVVFYDPAE